MGLPHLRIEVSVRPRSAGNLSKMKFLSLLAVALAPVAPAAAPLSIERIDDTSFRISVSAPESLGAAALQARLIPAAKLACRQSRAILGRYRIEGGNLDQELLCAEQVWNLDLARATQDPEWSPSAADQRALLAATYDYFAAKDAGRYADAYALLSDRMKASAPSAEWQAAARGFNDVAGRALGRRVVEISWYANPADAPEPGLYVAADYSAEFEKLEFVCGYVMWKLLPDGRFALVREEQNLARKRGTKPMAEIDREPLRMRLGCKD